ncbi:MAG: hypothetical protein KJO07_13095 [Deltaproteobacteria bacterium]|nr:hypothetical protein [Deltaproteobacteria bacterium]
MSGEISPEIRELLAKGDGEALVSASQGILESGDDEGFYLALLLALAAEDFGADADELLDLFMTAELAADEDWLLAQYQLAHWHATGTRVSQSDDRANQRFETILEGFEERPPLSEDAPIVERLAEMRAGLGVPNDLDFTLPLGPAFPGTTANVNPRHKRLRIGDSAPRWAKTPSEGELEQAVVGFFAALASDGFDAALATVALSWGDTGAEMARGWLEGTAEEAGLGETDWHSKMAVPAGAVEVETWPDEDGKDPPVVTITTAVHVNGKPTDTTAHFEVAEHDGAHIMTLDHFQDG